MEDPETGGSTGGRRRDTILGFRRRHPIPVHRDGTIGDRETRSARSELPGPVVIRRWENP